MTNTSSQKEDVEIELSEESYATLVHIASSRGVTIDEVIEDILRDAVNARRAEVESESDT